MIQAVEIEYYTVCYALAQLLHSVANGTHTFPDLYLICVSCTTYGLPKNLSDTYITSIELLLFLLYLLHYHKLAGGG